ncbi:LicD family protein [Proteus mirabilis]|nr:LicD family protein [Proteus mirabilis]
MKNLTIVYTVLALKLLSLEHIFSEDEIFPLKKIFFFEGYEFNCPNNTKIYLEKMFGPNYMTPPPEEERYNHS